MRKLTINRGKSFVAFVGRIFIYIELKDLSEGYKVLSINNKHFKLGGTISNGKTLTLDIPNEEVEIMIVFSASNPLRFNTSYLVPSGNEDVILNTKPIFSPSLGNPFIIEELYGK